MRGINVIISIEFLQGYLLHVFENRRQFRTCWLPVKITGGIWEMSASVLSVQLGSPFWYTFGGRLEAGVKNHASVLQNIIWYRVFVGPHPVRTEKKIINNCSDAQTQPIQAMLCASRRIAASLVSSVVCVK